MHDLFANYSKEVRPVIHKDEPIVVNFDMMFSQLVELVNLACFSPTTLSLHAALSPNRFLLNTARFLGILITRLFLQLRETDHF